MLINIDQISLSLGEKVIFKEANALINDGERICLMGRNGVGKSTLLSILLGQLQPSDGRVIRKANLRVSQLDQTLPEATDMPLGVLVKQGLKQQEIWLESFAKLSNDPNTPLTDIAELQAKIEAGGGWNIDQQIEKICSDLGLEPSLRLNQLSGGWRRRASLAKALVNQPELLLLDEPTNHLDISTIEWLEHRVRSYQGSVVFISHDRFFLQKLATRILEIDCGRIISYEGSYQHYLKTRAQLEAAEDTQNELFNKRLQQEEAWIRQGIKARRTRNEGRVRSLVAMREEADQKIKRIGMPRFAIAESSLMAGKKVIETHNLSFAYHGAPLLDRFNFRLHRGDRIGIIGNNGVGKSTLLQLLLGEKQPDQGTVKLGTNLEVGYFDQNQRLKHPEETVAYNINDGRDYLQINGGETHVVGYLKGFLFSPEKSLAPAKYLSGGEKNRVLLARLFAKPTNLLILDEPTNDLDIQMLEALESQLKQYQGTLIIVSHDRQFLDQVVDRILVFEADGKAVEHAGGYSDWVNKGRSLKIMEQLAGTNSHSDGKTIYTDTKAAKPNKLSYKEQRQLDLLPETIERLTSRIEHLTETIAQPEFQQQSFAEQSEILDELKTAQSALDEAENVWLGLAEKSEALKGSL